MLSHLKSIAEIFFFLVLASTVSSIASAVGQTHPQYLRLALSTPAISLDPTEKECNHEIAAQLFAGLTEIDPVTLLPIPSLATHWDISEDGTVYTFYLRKNALWSDENSITAHDAVATLERHLESFTPPQELLVIKNVQSFLNGDIEDKSTLGFRAVDEHTLQFTLEHPTPLFPVMTSFLPFRPLPVAVMQRCEAEGQDWTHPKRIVVSGPYTLARWRKKKILILKKNSIYFDASNVQIPEVHYAMVPSSEFALRMYQKNELDLTPLFKREQLADMRGDIDLTKQLSQKSRFETWYIGFNQSISPVDQPLVRKAIAAALDKQLLFEKVLRLMGNTASTFTSPPSFGHVDAEAKIGIPFDPQQARKWLAEAGYPDGRNFPKIYLSGPADVVLQPLKLMMQRTLNIQVSIQQLDEAPDAIAIHPHLFLLSKRAAYPDAYYFLSEFLLGTDESENDKLHWNNPKYRELVDSAFRQPDTSQRNMLYQQAEKLLCQEDAAIVPLFHRDIAWLAKPWLKWNYSPTGAQQIRTWFFKD